MKSIVLTVHEDERSIRYQAGTEVKYLEAVPEAIAEDFDKLMDFMTGYMTPKQQLEAEIISAFVESATPEELAAKPELFDEWTSGNYYTQGRILRRGGRLWRVLADHTAQEPPGYATREIYEDLTYPSDAEPAPFRAMTGPEDAYMAGEKYKDDEGTIWESLYDNNSSPANDFPSGWKKVNT